jgi:hypothetical protein
MGGQSGMGFDAEVRALTAVVIRVVMSARLVLMDGEVLAVFGAKLNEHGRSLSSTRKEQVSWFWSWF